MGLFSLNLDSFEDLYVAQLQDLYSAESQLIDALPQMAHAATHPELQRAFRDHLVDTQRQKERLEQIFQTLDSDPGGETCQAMKGLVKEGQEIIDADAPDGVRDAGLIAAAQRVEHYEIAGYGTVRTFAERLGRLDDAILLGESLSEEKEADGLLNQLAESVVNPNAAIA
jgi:ferritin-like metal-binding protein YciE